MIGYYLAFKADALEVVNYLLVALGGTLLKSAIVGIVFMPQNILLIVVVVMFILTSGGGGLLRVGHLINQIIIPL